MAEGRSCQPTLQIRAGHTLLLEERLFKDSNYLKLTAGLVRVMVSNPETEALEADTLTLGFLQQGDHLTFDLLRNTRLQLQALSYTSLEACDLEKHPEEGSSLHEWTVALLMVNRLHTAEHRITALLQLLVLRLGHRRGNWYELPLRFTHAELAELSGQTRVTVTRQLSIWRKQGLIEQKRGQEHRLRIAPQLMEA